MSHESGVSHLKAEMESVPAIILAGGLGTRLRSVISDIPKPMAPVNGKPFLHYIFQYLVKQGINKVVLSVGYKAEVVQQFFGNEYLGVKIKYSVEEEPLGTGGGIKKAFDLLNGYAFVLNGDTFFDVPLQELKDHYFNTQSDMALALKLMRKFDRYGSVQTDNANRILKFEEKKFLEMGLINGGVYFFHKSVFKQIPAEGKFSFEKEVLEKAVGKMKFTGKVFGSYFIDIGIPEDYEKVQHDFK